jgi:hypothetical protein
VVKLIFKIDCFDLLNFVKVLLIISFFVKVWLIISFLYMFRYLKLFVEYLEEYTTYDSSKKYIPNVRYV